jgi:single-strand selective monofunctional uracil DNA glycosylase
MNLIRITRKLSRDVSRLSFDPPVAYVYNPLDYARAPAEAYLKRFSRHGIEALWLGMNPGPFGMAQTGVPFGEISLVRDWIGIRESVGKPKCEHPKRPIQGFDCRRSEVSGARLWGWARDRFGTPEAFFARFFVWNYCPLVFMEDSGRNITPDKIPASEREPLFEVCDEALRKFTAVLEPRIVIGIGGFAKDRARRALGEHAPRVEAILHPSPASPLANRGWAAQAEKQLEAMGLDLRGEKRG